MILGDNDSTTVVLFRLHDVITEDRGLCWCFPPGEGYIKSLS